MAEYFRNNTCKHTDMSNWTSTLRATVLGIAGCTNSGKTTLANQLVDELKSKGCTVALITQDDYYRQKEEVDTLHNADDSSILFYDYDSVQSLKQEEMRSAILQSADISDFVVVEGIMLTDMPAIYELLDQAVFLVVDKQVCSQRRNKREYDPPDEVGYFEQVVWPNYEKTLSNAKKLDRLCFIDTGIKHIALIDLLKSKNEGPSFRLDIRRIQDSPINIEEVNRFIASPWCGASSIFVGTTRDTFEGKQVVKLEYECYPKMAYSEMRRICQLARQAFPALHAIAIVHRIGEVKVGESSIVMVTSAPQRTAALGATELLINELKKTVPIWKKEVYSDGSSSWKANQESVTSET